MKKIAKIFSFLVFTAVSMSVYAAQDFFGTLINHQGIQFKQALLKPTECINGKPADILPNGGTTYLGVNGRNPSCTYGWVQYRAYSLDGRDLGWDVGMSVDNQKVTIKFIQAQKPAFPCFNRVCVIGPAMLGSSSLEPICH